jgi:hypothetical protein
LIWYVKHYRDAQSPESVRCLDLAKARNICRDFEDMGETAWVEDERGHKLQNWEFPPA